ncbi:tudor domain-containing protein 7 [Danaus plexippus]|uniref:tudor domain-containing protein 7 n=1 Tax=Danaus plexippus TaxID=13037 RepID=UPI002AB2547D|nr:tudor domain-containing protein 7 [Danaus plexippus]XP_061385762.1 tudor domain-containing protein 7 [Danaus plexippus]XP_061385763.1 tudor domain-containing protein 7 [Danaus plexippus]
MADKEQVIQALRATLLSVKGAITIKQCNRDYRELQGEWIPFKKLGYPTLEKLFQDVPGFKITQVNGDWVVDAIASQETQHIASMVARQKTNKKQIIKLNHTNRFPKKQGSWRKPTHTSNYTSSYNNQYSNQYYRVKTTPFNNNSYNGGKYYKNNKSIDSKNSSISSKTSTKGSENQDKPVLKSVNSSSQIIQKSNIISDDYKHSIKNEKETDSKPNRKVSASQRLSKLCDRLSTVDLIPLQLPAHNNLLDSTDPVSVACPPPKLEPPPDSTAVEKLEWTCRKLGLPPPVYKVNDIRPKRGPVSYACNIKVGTYHSMSYPVLSPSEEAARELAAVNLLAQVESLEAGGLVTASAASAVAGLTALVAEHSAGLLAKHVPHQYREKHGENLPNNWLELIENCPYILKDRVANDLLVLLPNIEEPTSPRVENFHQDNTLDTDLPPLQFPEDDFWNVFITVANSTLEVWLRIIGPQYSDAFEVLLVDMATYYEHSGTTVDKSMIILNAWYAVNLNDGGWQRAKILEIEDETATVFLGDHGDDDTVYFKNIKILEPQFRKLPAQAILCRLEGAEELAASEAGATLVRRRLPGEVLVAAPGPRHDPTDPSVAVVLYDTSTPRDLNLNKEIVHDFAISGAFTLTQKLCEVEVGCVTEEGRVWVSRAGGAEAVRAALALLTSGPYRRPLPAAPHAPPTTPNALYIVRTLAGDWVRCIIISGLDGEGTVRTQLVDSGLILRAPLSSLVPLQAFSPALNEYPYQAKQVRLGPAERAAGSMVSRLRDMLLGASVLCRALPASAPSPGSPPNVELYARWGPQHMLASVNDGILMEYELIQLGKLEEKKEGDPTNHLEALHRKKERIFGTGSTGDGGGAAGGAEAVRNSLPSPQLPAKGTCIDVYVAMAANPWNFVVQPNVTRKMLQTMMSSLQVECPKLSESDAPTSPVSGELYTAFYDKDDTWYRVTIAGSVSSEMVSVYFCDFGDLALFANESLRPVPASVPLARSLPPQAIKARLYDVKPLHQDWTVEDCIRFQELCVEQQFVGVCKDVGKDPLNPTEPLVTLDLIDTSTDEDIYLNKQLVAEGRARLASVSSTK